MWNASAVPIRALAMRTTYFLLSSPALVTSLIMTPSSVPPSPPPSPTILLTTPAPAPALHERTAAPNGRLSATRLHTSLLLTFTLLLIVRVVLGAAAA